MKRLPAAFYETLSGRVPVREWLKSLGDADRKIIGEDINCARRASDRTIFCLAVWSLDSGV